MKTTHKIPHKQYMLSYCASGRIKNYALKTILDEEAKLSERKGLNRFQYKKGVFALKSNS